MTPEIKELVLKVFSEKYSDAAFCFVYGSAARGTERPSSDIDLIVVYSTMVTPYREKFVRGGFLMDVFVYDEESLNGALHMARAACNLVTVNAVMSAIALPAATPASEQLMEVARRIKRAGYLISNKPFRRQFVTNLLDDLADCVVAAERNALCVELYRSCCEIMLICGGAGTCKGKYVARRLTEIDPGMQAKLDQALSESLYGHIAPLVELAHQVLALIGGPLREGFRINTPGVTRMPLPVL